MYGLYTQTSESSITSDFTLRSYFELCYKIKDVYLPEGKQRILGDTTHSKAHLLSDFPEDPLNIFLLYILF